MVVKRGQVHFDEQGRLNLPEDNADFVTPHAQVLNCAKKGGDGVLAQECIDAITTASVSERWAINISPGEYTEKIIMKDYVSLQGVGTSQNVPIIKGTIGDLITVSNVDSAIQDMRFDLDPTTDGQCVMHLPNTVTGEITFLNCQFNINSSTPDITGRFLTQDGGTVRFQNCSFVYNMTGNGVTPKLHELFVFNGGNVAEFSGCRLFFSGIDDQDSYDIFVDNVDTSPFFLVVRDNTLLGTLLSASYSGTFKFFHLKGLSVANDRSIKNNILFAQGFNAAAGTLYAYYLDGAGSPQVDDNQVVLSGLQKNYHFHVEAGDTLRISNDSVTGDTDGFTGAGTVKGTYTKKPGEFKVSDVLEIPQKPSSPPQDSTIYTNMTTEKIHVELNGFARTIFHSGMPEIGPEASPSLIQWALNHLIINGDLDVFGTIDGKFIFADLYGSNVLDSIALPAQDTWYQMPSFDTDGFSNGLSPDHTSNHITVETAGKYLVFLAVSAHAAQSNNYEYQVKTNNGTVDCPNVMFDRTLPVAGAIGSGMTFGICNFAANDTIEGWVQRTDGGAVSKTLVIDHVNILAFKVSR